MSGTKSSLIAVDAGQLVSPIGELNVQLESYLKSIGLPVTDVVASISERKKIITQLSDALEILPYEDRAKSYYLSRFTIAIAAGLFDGALNYLWDETVRALRLQVIAFDVQYFYSVAEKISSRYKGLSKPEEIDQISEHDLLEGCRRVGLVTDVNYQRLEHVNYMRNHASAAHPNDNVIDGYEMLGWLTVCLKHAITAEPDHSLISIKQLLQNIRTISLPAADFPAICYDLAKQPQERIDDFLWTIFGIYIDDKTAQHARENIEGICSGVWQAATEDRKYEIGARFGTLRKNGEVSKKDACNKFLENVNGSAYKDEDSLAGELIEKLDNLYRAHFGSNNFYNEYPHAKALKESLPATGKIPRAARAKWVKIISICYVGNGHGYRQGVDEQAMPYYSEYVNNFTDSDTVEFIKLFLDPEFTSPLTRSTPNKRVRDLAAYLKPKHKNVHLLRALDLVITAPASTLYGLHNTSDFKNVLPNLPI
ncbi:hypothetical protein [Pseudomonas viridiflava]|uniref:hypothetical protein n=1 Tax=Pseudomonas viridiflava TaxID=33069 RepID=UPI000F01E9E4|nr:hypothetical protein [Pseudomonas viridiflava]